MRKIILDANAYTRFLAGDEDVFQELSKAHIVWFSVIVLGEVYAGFKGGTKETENREILEKFLNKTSVELIGVSKETAEIFGELKYQLKKDGKPLPINDIWLAANAIETGSVLVTYDKHFLQISGLRLWHKL